VWLLFPAWNAAFPGLRVLATLIRDGLSEDPREEASFLIAASDFVSRLPGFWSWERCGELHDVYESIVHRSKEYEFLIPIMRRSQWRKKLVIAAVLFRNDHGVAANEARGVLTAVSDLRSRTGLSRMGALIFLTTREAPVQELGMEGLAVLAAESRSLYLLEQSLIAILRVGDLPLAALTALTVAFDDRRRSEVRLRALCLLSIFVEDRNLVRDFSTVVRPLEDLVSEAIAAGLASCWDLDPERMGRLASLGLASVDERSRGLISKYLARFGIEP
jgi:hypothetical protein